MTKPAYKLPDGLKVPKSRFATEEYQRRLKEDDGRLTVASISREVRERLYNVTNVIDLDRYFIFLAVHHPELFVPFMEKLFVAKDETPMHGIQIVVNQIVSEPQATPGVLASPIQAHVMARPELRLIERAESVPVTEGLVE